MIDRPVYMVSPSLDFNFLYFDHKYDVKNNSSESLKKYISSLPDYQSNLLQKIL